MTGYVYFASNPAYPEDYVKVGRTDRPDVRKRIKELKTSAVPKAFEIVAVFACEDSKRLESDLHDVFGDKRVDGDREFFKLDKDTIRLARTLLSSTCMDLTEFFEAREGEPFPNERVAEEPPGETASAGAEVAAEDGTRKDRRPGAKIPPETDAAIKRDLRAGLSRNKIANKYGVSEGAVFRRSQKLKSG